MFTGLVAERGRLSREPEPCFGGGVRIRICHSPGLSQRLGLGASLAVAGVCLTLIEAEDEASTVELSAETLSRTTLGSLGKGSEVNLEPALRVGDPMGGHWVQGHVDGTTTVLDRRDLDEHRVLTFALPEEQLAGFVEKGSVTLDGVSLTVAALSTDRFDVALIPHTLSVTTLVDLQRGDRVNFEIDILSKYIEQALAVRGWSQQ